MAKGYINGIYSKTFLDGREFQPWLSDTGAQLAGEGPRRASKTSR